MSDAEHFEAVSYTPEHCLKLVRNPWRMDTRFWMNKDALRHVPFTLRAQLRNSMLREERMQKERIRHSMKLGD